MTPGDDPRDPGSRHASAAPAGRVADAPPVRLPALHFCAALLFLAAGGAGLLWSAPALAAGSFSAPRVVAAFHLLTLGWIGTSIMGAATQLLPVALGAPLLWEGSGYASFAAWTAGAAAFTGGMAASWPAAYLFGGGALGIGALLFAANLWATLPRAPERDLTWWCLAAAGLFLLAGWLLGLLLAVNLTSGILGATRYSVLVVHVHLAAGGWVLLTMIGVGHRLLPRFLGSRGVPAWPGRAAAGLTALGAALLLASEHVLPVGVVRLGLWAMAAGAAAFGLEALLHFARRSRGPGATMGLAGAGVAGVVLAAAAGGALLLSPRPDPGLATTYGLLLVPAGMALFVAGFQGRIVRFLARLHGVGPGRAEGDGDGSPADTLAGRLRARLFPAGAALLAGGGLALAAGALAGSRALALAAAAAYAVGALLLAADLLPAGWRLVRERSPGGPPAPG